MAAGFPTSGPQKNGFRCLPNQVFRVLVLVRSAMDLWIFVVLKTSTGRFLPLAALVVFCVALVVFARLSLATLVVFCLAAKGGCLGRLPGVTQHKTWRTSPCLDFSKGGNNGFETTILKNQTVGFLAWVGGVGISFLAQTSKQELQIGHVGSGTNNLC